MSVLLTSDAPTLFEAGDGAPTLDDLVAGIWEDLRTHRVVACPVCGAEMVPVYGAHALPIGGGCGSCGSALR